MLRTSAALLLTFALGCGRAKVEPLAPDAADAGSDAGSDAGADAGDSDAGPEETDAGLPDAGPVTYQIARVALHVHSAISHDACDHHGAAGGPLVSLDRDCLVRLEEALVC